MAGQTLEFSPLVQSTDRQADSRARPFSRRALMIARPARVLMRARNPCLRARRRVLGWKVRFKAAPKIHGWATNGGGVTVDDLTSVSAHIAYRPCRTGAVWCRPVKATAA
jgi:hypothetical protein